MQKRRAIVVDGGWELLIVSMIAPLLFLLPAFRFNQARHQNSVSQSLPRIVCVEVLGTKVFVALPPAALGRCRSSCESLDEMRVQ